MVLTPLVLFGSNTPCITKLAGKRARSLEGRRLVTVPFLNVFIGDNWQPLANSQASDLYADEAGHIISVLLLICAAYSALLLICRVFFSCCGSVASPQATALRTDEAGKT
jgi:hypothetical protein